MALKVVQSTKTVTTAGAAEALAATPYSATTILIQADSLNTGNIYVGDSNVDSTDGYAIPAGCELALTGDQIRGITEGMLLSDVFLDADTDGNSVRFLIFTRRTVPP